MRRVRYLAGAAGIAPVAFGLAAAPGLGHATEAQAGNSHARSVSLHHVIGSQAAVLTAALSSAKSTPGTSTPSNSPNLTGTGCKGTIARTVKSGGQPGQLSQTLRFWWTRPAGDNRICIGTVEGSAFLATSSPVSLRIRIWDANAHTKVQATSSVFEKTRFQYGPDVSATPHRYGKDFAQAGSGWSKVEVCGQWVLKKNHNPISSFGPLCTTVHTR
jgi:hypothetical protein